MGTVKFGDRISIKNPERNSLVKAGRLQLRVPDNITTEVPDTLSKRDLGLLSSLVEWGVLVVNEEPKCQQNQLELDPLDTELIVEYTSLSASEAVEFLKGLSAARRDKFISYERNHKKRTTVLKVFDAVC